MVGLKTHSKVVLVVRDDGDRLRRYCHIGTGNYNSKTARIYEDLGILTCDAEIGADAAQLFNHLTGYSRTDDYSTLLVAPRDLKRQIIDLIEHESAFGPEGSITLKCNGIADGEVIDALYAASQAGTRIDMLVRGVCCLRAGVPGLSENIRVRSVLGRYPRAQPDLSVRARQRARRRSNRSCPGQGGGRRCDPPHRLGRPDAAQPDPSGGSARADHPSRHAAWLDQALAFGLDDDVVAWELRCDDTWERVGPLDDFVPAPAGTHVPLDRSSSSSRVASDARSASVDGRRASTVCRPDNHCSSLVHLARGGGSPSIPTVALSIRNGSETTFVNSQMNRPPRSHRVNSSKRRIFAGAIALALVAAACGSDDDSSDDAPAASDAPAGSEAPAGSDAPAGRSGTDAPAGTDAPGGTRCARRGGIGFRIDRRLGLVDRRADLRRSWRCVLRAEPRPGDHGGRAGHRRRVRAVLCRRDRRLRRVPPDQRRGSRGVRGLRHRVHRTQGRGRRALRRSPRPRTRPSRA